MPKAIPLDINQTQKERLSHIDFKAHFLGTIGRNDLVNRFGIKEAAATRDITLYKDLAPENLEYDTKAKVYVRGTSFEPLFDYSPSQAMAALAYGFGDDFVGKHKALVACEAPAQLNHPDLDTLSALTRAIHQHKPSKIVYRSLSSGRTTREIVPFVLVDNGLRWHVRGYDRKQSRFADFVVTRISDPEILDGPVKEHEGRESDIQMLFRTDEARLSLAEAGRAWAFDAPADGFKLGLEAYRIRLAHLFDPMMAVHSSNVQPLPHQITAVYEPCCRASRCAMCWPTTPAPARPSWPGS
jgi:hypothetical protein